MFLSTPFLTKCESSRIDALLLKNGNGFSSLQKYLNNVNAEYADDLGIHYIESKSVKCSDYSEMSDIRDTVTALNYPSIRLFYPWNNCFDDPFSQFASLLAAHKTGKGLKVILRVYANHDKLEEVEKANYKFSGLDVELSPPHAAFRIIETDSMNVFFGTSGSEKDHYWKKHKGSVKPLIDKISDINKEVPLFSDGIFKESRGAGSFKYRKIPSTIKKDEIFESFKKAFSDCFSDFSSYRLEVVISLDPVYWADSGKINDFDEIIKQVPNGYEMCGLGPGSLLKLTGKQLYDLRNELHLYPTLDLEDVLIPITTIKIEGKDIAFYKVLKSEGIKLLAMSLDRDFSSKDEQIVKELEALLEFKVSLIKRSEI